METILSLVVVTIPSKYGGQTSFLPLVTYMRRIAGFNLLMVLALVGLLLGTEIHSMFLPFIHLL